MLLVVVDDLSVAIALALAEDSALLRQADSFVRIGATDYLLNPTNPLVGQLYLNAGYVIAVLLVLVS